MGLCQRTIRNSHITYNKTFYVYFLDAKIQLLYIFGTQLYPEETTVFFLFKTLLGPFWWVWGNNSSKQRKTELKF